MQKAAGSAPMRAEHAGVGRRVLLGDDLDALEELGHPGGGHLGLLVEQVALGDQHQPVVAAPSTSSVSATPSSSSTGCASSSLPRERISLDAGAVDAVLREREGGLDHREREALHAVAEQGQVAPLGLEQGRRTTASASTQGSSSSAKRCWVTW